MSDQSKTRVGFIGLGDQGGPMARAVAEAGFELHVWARRATSLQAVQGVRHTVSTSPKRLAEATDTLLLCLRDDQTIIHLLDDGLEQGLRPGFILVNHGTGEPVVNRQLAQRLRAMGVAFLDALVSGGLAVGAGTWNRTGHQPFSSQVKIHAALTEFTQPATESVAPGFQTGLTYAAAAHRHKTHAQSPPPCR